MILEMHTRGTNIFLKVAHRLLVSLELKAQSFTSLQFEIMAKLLDFVQLYLVHLRIRRCVQIEIDDVV